MELRYSPDVNSYKKLSTEDLRKSFLVEHLFEENKVCSIYSDADRAIIGSASHKKFSDAESVNLGSSKDTNKRTIYKYIHLSGREFTMVSLRNKT